VEYVYRVARVPELGRRCAPVAWVVALSSSPGCGRPRLSLGGPGAAF